MSQAGSFDAKERIKQAVDIVELVSEYLPLRREGSSFKGICPWHDDSRPSLHVNPQRQTFRCFVCDLGGDIFSFIMKREGVEFVEALRILADRAGIPLERGGNSAVAKQQADERTLMREALAWAIKQYHRHLIEATDAEIARTYLADREVSDDSIQQFQLGFAPAQWSWLLQQPGASAFSPQMLETAGLVSPRTSGGFYDRFRGRLLFPILDPQGRPIAFGGRVLPGVEISSPAKYINSPESPLFSKSDVLYGMNHARSAISQARTVAVVEGYTDCIAAHQFGFDNVVAVLGTALGPAHIRLLRGLADRVILVLDGDDAGKRRANEILELFIAEAFDLRILTLPENSDPCEVLASDGREVFARMLDTAIDALEHKFTVVAGRLDSRSSMHDLNRAAEEVLATVAKAPRLHAASGSAARLREDQLLHRLARLCQASEQSLRSRLADLRRGSSRTKMERLSEPSFDEVGSPDEADSATENRWQRDLVELLIRHPELLPQAREQIDPNHLVADRARGLFLKCCELQDAGVEPTFDRLMLEFDQPEDQSYLVGIDTEGESKEAFGEPAQAKLSMLMERYKNEQHLKRHQANRSRLDEQELPQDEEADILRQLIDDERNRRQLF